MQFLTGFALAALLFWLVLLTIYVVRLVLHTRAGHRRYVAALQAEVKTASDLAQFRQRGERWDLMAELAPRSSRGNDKVSPAGSFQNQGASAKKETSGAQAGKAAVPSPLVADASSQEPLKPSPALQLSQPESGESASALLPSSQSSPVVGAAVGASTLQPGVTGVSGGGL